MRIVYLGTPDFSVNPLKSILDNTSHEVIAVVCNKDKPFGRKKILTPPPVKVFANERGIPVYQYDRIKVEGVSDLKKLNPDLMITCAFGQILSKEILDIPRYGVINIHASLLPKYRGASPIHFAILNGEKTTGISIMKTEEGIDTGDVILQKSIEIKKGETCGELFDRLSYLGAQAIEEALTLYDNNKVTFVPQEDNDATYTKIIKKEMAQINWDNTAEYIYNQVRAFNPAPVAFTFLNGEIFKVYECEIVDMHGESGTILDNNKKLVIGCKDKAVSLLSVQKAGGKQMKISDFLLGNKFNLGEKVFQ